jgi:glyoxylase-like metal-dependent hydrolase (beta-lactamase superfamily II)
MVDIGAFLVHNGDRLTLIDAGAGPGSGNLYTPRSSWPEDEVPQALLEYADRRGFKSPDAIRAFLAKRLDTDIHSGALGDSLAKAGFSRDDVTDVVLSHLHFDHIGWVSQDGYPCFPNAIVRCEQSEASRIGTEDDSAYGIIWNAVPTSERMAPVLAGLEVWDGRSELMPELTAIPAPGHTSGSTIFMILSRGEYALILGDAVHLPYELIEPNLIAVGDEDARAARESRSMIRDLAIETSAAVSAPHFYSLRFGRLSTRTDDEAADVRFEWL